MELRQLEYFVAVAEEANFTRAAARIRVAQPAVSAQIQRLEREVGQQLLDRSRRSVRLTAAGAAALPYAKTVLQAVSDMQVAVDDVGQLIRGTVSIGTVTSHNVDIPRLLADFHADHPGVEITLGMDSSDNLIENVRTGRLDVAIAAVGPDEVPDGVAVETTTDEAITAAVARTDPLATRKTIQVTDLRDRAVIALPVGAGIRRQFDRACAQAGVTPRIAFEASSPLELADMAERGLGVAIVPESVPRGRDDLHALAFVPELRGRLVLAWRSAGPVSPAARVLIDRARRLLRVTARA
ncbi:LysR family transcriptional regulator [Mycolicibacterium agri]|nr:LysR family transcriptional regulator [Mycolicibacterium agri]PEG35130.1 LysR family transcriptional regulator [Mycolicibacterium agri]